MNKFYLFCALLSLIIMGCSTERGIVWQQILHKKRANGVEKMIQLKTGEFVAIGHTQGKFTPWTDNYNTDLWIITLDTDGQIIWDKVIGDRDRNLPRSLVETDDGGYLISTWHKEKDSTYNEKYNVFNKQDDYKILKLNSQGNFLWDKVINGEGYDFVQDVQETNDGGYIVSGSSYSKAGLDKKDSSIGSQDFWIVKLDSTRNIEWQKSFGGGRKEKLESLIQTIDGGYFLAGFSDSIDKYDEFPNEPKMNDYFVLMLNGKGNPLWYKMYGGSGDDMLDVAIQTKDKNYLLAGLSNSKMGEYKTTENIGSYDIWVVKVDPLGKIIWQNSYGGKGPDNIETLQELENGDIIIGGTKAIQAIVNDTVSYQKDFSVLKINEIGLKKWELNLGKESNDILYSAYQIANNNIIVAGRTQSFVSKERTMVKGSNDIWLLEYNADRLNEFEKKLKIDNLSSNNTVLISSHKLIQEVEYFNNVGELIEMNSINNKKLVIDKSNIKEKNVFYIKLNSDFTSAVIKVADLLYQ